MAHIRYANSVEFNGSLHGRFPVILSEDLTVHRLSLRFLLSLRTKNAERTLITYAHHLCDFLTQLEIDNNDCPYEQKFAWDEIDDCWLESYRNALLSRTGTVKDNRKNYVAQVLRTVIAYLEWTQKKGFSYNLIGISDLFRIRLAPSKKEGNVSHPLVTSYSKDTSEPRTAPRMDWIENVKAYTKLVDKKLQVRFELMVDWGVVVGLRAHEICALNIDQLPQRITAENAAIAGKNVFINVVVSKGSKPKVIPINPLLVKKTWDYIENDRSSIVSAHRRKKRKKKEVYVESPIIFLSSSTGRALHPRSFSNQVRSAFLYAVKCGVLTMDELVWLHGLRHRFTTDILKSLDSAGVKRTEEVAKHLTRHSSPDSLETYSIGRFFEDINGS
jgi:integrase